MPRSPIHTTVSSRTPISLYRRPDRCRDRDDLLPHPDRASVMLPELRDQPVARKHWAFGVEAVSTPGTTPSGPVRDSTNHRSEYCRRAPPLRARSSTDRASDYGSEGWGFESLRAHHMFDVRNCDMLDRVAVSTSFPIGAPTSSNSIASIAALNSSNRGDTRTGVFRGGGSACDNAVRTVARPTPYRAANARIDAPSAPSPAQIP